MASGYLFSTTYGFLTIKHMAFTIKHMASGYSNFPASTCKKNYLADFCFLIVPSIWYGLWFNTMEIPCKTMVGSSLPDPKKLKKQPAVCLIIKVLSSQSCWVTNGRTADCFNRDCFDYSQFQSQLVDQSLR